MRYLFLVIMSFVVFGCTSNSDTEKFQSSRKDVVDVSENIKEWDTGDVLIGSVSRFYVGDEYLCIADYKSYDNSIHLFSLSDLNHVVSCGMIGPGPNEITVLGHIEMDGVHNKMYVSDHGKYRIFSYDLDSLVLAPSIYKHQTKTKFSNSSFPDSYCYINDTLAYARVIQPTSVSTFDQGIGKWNMKTGEIKMMPYSHPEIKNKRSLFDVSLTHNFYAEVYLRHDLITLCDLDGNLICNIYGPDWDGGGRSGLSCFGGVVVTEKYIIASYSGGDYNKEYYPTKLLFFNLNGDYVKTLDVKRKINHFCYNPKQNSVVMSFNDEIQFGYLELTSLGL